MAGDNLVIRQRVESILKDWVKTDRISLNGNHRRNWAKVYEKTDRMTGKLVDVDRGEKASDNEVLTILVDELMRELVLLRKERQSLKGT